MVFGLHFVAGQQRRIGYPREVCEHVLAHKLPDEVEAAYLRGAYLEKRKGLMADWAEFCCKLLLVFIEKSHNKIACSTTTPPCIFTEYFIRVY